MKYLRKFNEEIKIKDVILTTAMLLGVGLSKSDAQTVNNDPAKASIVKNVYDYNKKSIDYSTLKDMLKQTVSNVDYFMKNYLEVTPQRTYVIKANFIPLSFDYNSQIKTANLTYKINLKNNKGK